jgi:DNA-binding transcriptional MerR regulator
MTTIKVSKIFENESKTGKKYWKVIDENKRSYSVWDEEIIKQIAEGQSVSVGIEDSKGFLNIKSVGPSSDIPTGFEDLFDANGNAPKQNPFNQGAEQLTPKKSVVDEVRLIVEERIAAIDATARLIAGGKADIKDLEDIADRIIAYYHQTAIPKVQTDYIPSGSEEFLA